MKNKVFLVMLLSIAALSAGCNTVAGAKDIRAAEKRSRTPKKWQPRSVRAAQGRVRDAQACRTRLSPGRCWRARRLDGRKRASRVCARPVTNAGLA